MPKLDPGAARTAVHLGWRPEFKGSSAGTSWPKPKRRPFVARFPVRDRPAVGDGKPRRLLFGGCCPVVISTLSGGDNIRRLPVVLK